MFKRSYDLLAAIAVAILGLLVASASGGISNPILVAVSLPLVLLLPGYTLSVVLVPSRTFGLAERLLLSLGVSVALAVLGGLLLNLLPGPMTPGMWRTFLAGFTITVAAFGIWRRERGAAGPGRLVTRLATREAALVAGGALLVGLALGLAAIGIDPIDSTASANTRFTQLWIVPDANQKSSMRVGLQNYEAEAETYRVTLEAGGSVFAEWPQVSVARGAAWQAGVRIPSGLAGQPVTANAYRPGDTTPYRHVRLSPQLIGVGG